MINTNALNVLKKLESFGFQAYFVGGCIRDLLMNRSIHDFDITTDALPQQIVDIFSSHTVILTGLKHGTVTIIIDSEPFEITTFRVDGEYSDLRRPDSVNFVTDLTEDLARRDFTMNAIAMDSSGKFFDPFGGRHDIETRVIRCVGDPEKRFTEDSLRILRTIRFAAVLGFNIEEQTSIAILKFREKLCHVSANRIREELTKIICGKNLVNIMLKYRDIFSQFIPELIHCFDLDQHSPYHKYDVYEHTVRAIDAIIPNDTLLRTTMLYHDLGKPHTFKLDENNRGHFQKHAQIGATLALNIMRRLQYDNSTIRKVCTLIWWHNHCIFTEKDIKTILACVSPELFPLLIEVKKADNIAKYEFILKENKWLDQCAKIAAKFVKNNLCITLGQLAVDGNDMIALGLKSNQISITLKKLLKKVIIEELPNNRDALITFVKNDLVSNTP